MKKSILLKALFLSLIISCSAPVVEIPKDVLAKDKMISILVDVHLAEAAISINNAQRDTSKVTEYYEFIYKNHSTTKKQFTESYDFYLAHPEILNKIYDDVLVELSKKQTEAVKKH